MIRAKKSLKKFFEGPKINSRTFFVRGVEVMLDSDVAITFRTTTKYVNQVVGRHKDRFPKDFVFRVSGDEFKNLRLQIATSNSGYEHGHEHTWDDLRGGRRYLPYVFTPLGMNELAALLKWDIDE